MCQLNFLNYTHSNRNNDANILHIFTANVKLYIMLHLFVDMYVVKYFFLKKKDMIFKINVRL